MRTILTCTDERLPTFRIVPYGIRSIVNSALAAAPALTTAFSASPLATQLKTVARMIAVRDRLGMSRQIYFVAAGGFDTHDAQLPISRCF